MLQPPVNVKVNLTPTASALRLPGKKLSKPVQGEVKAKFHYMKTGSFRTHDTLENP
jgi:hypothetical protein